MIDDSLYTKEFELSLISPMLGTIPKNKELFKKYIIDKFYHDGEANTKELKEEQETQEQVEQKLSPTGDGETGFFTDPDGIYLMDYHIKGFLKEAGNILKDVLKVKALRSKLDNFVFVEPRFIWLKEKPDGIFQRPLRAMTRMGERVTLVASDVVNPPCSFRIKITLINHKEITWKIINTLLDYGKLKGIGQWRNAGYGRFTYKEIKKK